MRFTLHDNIHPSAGEADASWRPAIDDAARAPWVRAMHERLAAVPPDGGAFAADLDADVGTLRVRARRHGAALSASWSVGVPERVVAASVLLAGEVPADDDLAARSLRDHAPPLPFGDADFAALRSEPRPCLGTMYLDARWYANARVELAATAMALAAMFGPSGRLSVEGAPPAAAAPSPPPDETAPRGGLKFNFTRERLQLVMEMVTKKGSAAIEHLPGVHFRVYPPREFVGRPGVLRGRNVFDTLRDSTWWVRWYDNRCDRLAFGELLGFLDQLLEVEKAFAAVTGTPVPQGPAPLNASTWGERPPAAGRRPVKVGRTLDARALVEDAHIRRLLAAVALEPAPLPPATAPASSP